MTIETTKVFEQLLHAYLDDQVQVIVVQGGARCSKTVSILQLIKMICDRHKLHASVVSESLPHLKKGALKDFKEFACGEQYSPDDFHKTDHIHTCNKGTIEFFGADSSGKVHGPSRDILHVNEAQNIDWETFWHLHQRTSRVSFIDFNPVSSFWVHEKLIPMLKESEYRFFKFTYKDNRLIPPKIKADIERRAAVDDNYRRVYAEGEIGSLEGLIFPSFTLVDSMPDTDKRRIGVDFGYTNDPTAIMDVRLQDGKLWIDELEYRTGMSNSDIASVIKKQGAVTVICDSAEPKSIDDLIRMGIKAKGAIKGPGSVSIGIEKMQSYPIMVTKRSVNIQKELRNYQWAKSRDGKTLNEPVDIWNHGADSVRYAVSDLTTQKELKPARTFFSR